MIEIDDDNNITMTRGDTLIVRVPLANQDDTPYTPAVGDAIRFAMKKKYEDTECVLKKNIPTSTMILRLDSEDTENLPQKSSYVFDIEITTADGIRYTFLNKKKLKLTEEVD